MSTPSVSGNVTPQQYVFTFYDIPKLIPGSKLRNAIQRIIKTDSWFFQLIPLEKCNIAQVVCESEIYNRFVNTTFNLTVNGHDLSLKAEPANAFDDSGPKLTHDCLRQIFLQCAIKDQITLAKVCQDYLDVIIDIWRFKYKYLDYNLYDFEFEFKLSIAELQDFCTLVGNFVERLSFDSTLYFPLIQKHLLNCGGYLMESAKIFINENLCRNLEHFENVSIFEVQGKFLADFTIRELARYCRQIKVFKLLDANTRWLRGTNFYLMDNLEHLCIRDCESFQRNHFYKAVSRLKLKSLNIVACRTLNNSVYLTRICPHFKHLHTLQMSANASVPLLKAILRLTALKVLQFYWINDFETFEELLFTQMMEHRKACDYLESLKFCVERVFMDNESHECLTEHTYAFMRENVTANGRWWQFHGDRFYSLCITLAHFENLNQITCEYCRPFSYENMLKLPEMCENLKSLKLIGCRDEEMRESQMLYMWEMQVPNCELSIEGIIPGAVVQNLNQQIFRLPYRINDSVVLRSIECRFK